MKKMMLLGFFVLTMVSIFFCAQACAESVMVEKNDSFWKIAKRHNVSWAEIQEINRDNLIYPGNFDFIYPGQFMEIPTAKTGEIAVLNATERVVEKNDSFWKIAKTCNVPLDELKRINRDNLVYPGNFDLIYPGQTLKLPIDVVRNISVSGKDDEISQRDNSVKKDEFWLEMEVMDVVEIQQSRIKDARKVKATQSSEIVPSQKQTQKTSKITPDSRCLRQAKAVEIENRTIVSNVSKSHAKEVLRAPDIFHDLIQNH